MYPEICKIGMVTVYSYGLMLVVAFGMSALLIGRAARDQGMDADILFNFCFVVFISGVVGARLFYIIENLEYYWRQPLEIIMVQHGGLAWFGGFIAGMCAAFLFVRRKKLSLLKVLDLLAPYLALAQAIGRIGCMFNGCCYGRMAEVGIFSREHGAILVPTQLYSACALLIIYATLRFVQQRPHAKGMVIAMYFFLYSLKRFLIEFWRADNARVCFGLTLFQLLSIVLFVVSVCMISCFLRKKGRA